MTGTSYVSLILWAEARNGWHWLTRTNGGRRTGLAVGLSGVVIGPPLGAGTFVAGFALGRFHIDPTGVLALAFSIVAGMMFIFGLPGIIGAFFGDRQLLLYAAAPVPAFQLFLARLVQAALPSLAIALLPLALAAGYGAGRGVDAAWFVVALLLVVLMAAMVVAFAAALMSFVLRVVPAQRAREAATLLLAVTAAAFYVVQFQFIGRARVHVDPTVLVTQAGMAGDQLVWLPTSWPAETLAAWSERGPVAAAPWLAMTVAATVACLVAGWTLHRRTFVLGLGVYGQSGSRVRAWRWLRRRPVEAHPARPVLALAAKDLRTLRRDFRRLASVLPAVMVAAVYTVALPRRFGGLALWQVILPLGFVSFMISLVLGLPAIASEGRGWQLLTLAGFSPRQLLTAKLLWAVPAAAILTELGVVAIAVTHGGNASDIAVAVATGAWLATGCTAIAVGAGSISPDFTADTPRRAVGAPGTLVGLFANFGFAFLTYGGIAMIWFSPLARGWQPILIAAGALLLAGSAGLAVAVLAIALRALTRYRPD